MPGLSFVGNGDIVGHPPNNPPTAAEINMLSRSNAFVAPFSAKLRTLTNVLSFATRLKFAPKKTGYFVGSALFLIPALTLSA
jgi:hypothetical protein